MYDLSDKIKIIQEIIEEQVNIAHYTGFDYTRVQFLAMYQAFQDIIILYPKPMVEYLINSKRGGSLQCKIYQHFVKLIEKHLPITVKKNNTQLHISSLLDSNLNLFDGISYFDTTVLEKGIVKNATTEFYIGGRTSTYVKPFYIGYLLDIINKQSGLSILSDVRAYSFTKIFLETTKSNTPVSVSHLRIPPHYQMGGMTYLNRAKKKISEKIPQELKG